MTYGEPAQAEATVPRKHPAGRVVSRGRIVRPSQLWAVAVVAIGLAVTGCSGGLTSPTAATATPRPTTTADPAGGSGSSGGSTLAEAVAFSQCMRSHGVPNFPDPVRTPSGGYGYRTVGIDPNSAAFQGALQACKGLPSPWNSAGQQLTPAQQQSWLTWAQCIRAHGVPSFPDPTFSGSEVHDSGVASNSPRLQSAMDACRSQMPSAGGLGG